jgi:hypothetical protein
MFEVALIAAGVCAPDTLVSLPYVEFAVEGDGRQYVEDEGEVSTTEDGKYPVVGGHCVSIG